MLEMEFAWSQLLFEIWIPQPGSTEYENISYSRAFSLGLVFQLLLDMLFPYDSVNIALTD